MTNTSRWLCVAGGTLVVLSSSVNAQPYYPYSRNPYYPPVMSYQYPDSMAWNPSPNYGYMPPPSNFDAPREPYFRVPPPDDRELWSRRPKRMMPPSYDYRSGWGPPNPYTDGYGATPWTIPQRDMPPPYTFMPPYGTRPPFGYYPPPYPDVPRGFSPTHSYSPNICH